MRQKLHSIHRTMKTVLQTHSWRRNVALLTRLSNRAAPANASAVPLPACAINCKQIRGKSTTIFRCKTGTGLDYGIASYDQTPRISWADAGDGLSICDPSSQPQRDHAIKAA